MYFYIAIKQVRGEWYFYFHFSSEKKEGLVINFELESEKKTNCVK